MYKYLLLMPVAGTKKFSAYLCGPGAEGMRRRLIGPGVVSRLKLKNVHLTSHPTVDL